MEKTIYIKKANKSTHKNIGRIVVFSGLMLFALAANAQATYADMTIGDVAAHIETQIPGILDVMEAAAYIGGIVLGIKGILKLKENNESKGKVPLTTPIMLILAAVFLLALPTVIDVGVTGLSLDSGTGTQGQFTH